MTRAQLQPNHRSIEAEAAAWIAQLDGSDPSQEDLAALREWMNRSPAHRQAIERLSSLWDDLNVLTQLGVPGPGAASSRARRQRRRWIPGLSVAAAAAVVVLLGVAATFTWWRGWDGAEVPADAALAQSGSYRTQVGEQRTVLLADGSRLTLNTGTQVVVDLDASGRGVHLVRGEALFEVAADPSREFRVYAGNGFVRAIGTAFTVYLEDEGNISVTVAEGVVELGALAPLNDDPAQGSSGQPRDTVLAKVSAGQLATFGRKLESIRSVEEKEISRRLAWRDGMLRFDGEPLAEVVRQVSRYTTDEIVIADPALRDLRIGGYFKTGETRAMLEALQSGFEVRVERIDEDTVRLHARR